MGLSSIGMDRFHVVFHNSVFRYVGVIVERKEW